MPAVKRVLAPDAGKIAAALAMGVLALALVLVPGGGCVFCTSARNGTGCEGNSSSAVGARLLSGGGGTAGGGGGGAGAGAGGGEGAVGV